MDTNSKSFDIINGPGRDVLFDAFKYAYDKNSVISTSFTVALSGIKTRSGECFQIKTKDYKITSIEHEDGSGQSFNIRGYCSADIRLGAKEQIYEWYKFTAYYNARTRMGYISLTK